MTSTITVEDRRRATLERLHGADTTERRGRRRRLPARRTSRSARASVESEVLGPPTGTFYAIAGVISVLVMLGLVMVLSASAVTQANLGFSPYRVFVKQAVWAGMGAVALVLMVKISYRRWQRLAIPVTVLAVAAMAAPFAPGIGASVNGARSWMRAGPLSFQPSELLKIAVVILTADLLTRRRNDLGNRVATLFPLGSIAAVGAGLCLVLGDLGAAIVLGAIVISGAWVAGVPGVPLAGRAAAAVGAGVVLVVWSARRLERVTAFL